MTDDEPEREGPEPVVLGQALDRVLRSMRGGARRDEIGGVFGGWDDAVGPAVAAHVRPVRLDRGILVVDVDDPAWATQVRLLSAQLIDRLADATGVRITRLEIRVQHPRRGRRG